MKDNTIYNEYQKLVFGNKNEYLKDFERLKKLEVEKKFLYKNKPIPFAYQGLFISETDEQIFKNIVKTMNSIIRKVTNKFLNDSSYRKLFGFSPEMEDLILHDPMYDIPVPIGRYDIFYNNDNDFKFCEINTDGSSAMREDASIASLILDSKSLSDIKDYSFSSYELFESWVTKSLNLYKSIKGDFKNITVAIVDLEEAGTPDEFLDFQKTYIQKGVDCIIVDPRELEYDETHNHLVYKNTKIDMVYRRLATSEAFEKYDELKDFFRAYLKNAFVCIGSFRSQVAHNKIFFEILHRDETLSILDKNEKEFIINHIPLTKKFVGGDDVLKHVIENKDKYIMKPTDRNSAKGVYVGREMSKEEFEKQARSDFNKDYIYQEFVLPKKMEFINEVNGDFVIEKRGNMIGLFSYLEEFAGVYARMGLEDIIGSIREYICAPGIKYVKK